MSNAIVLTEGEREALVHAACELRGLQQDAVEQHWYDLYNTYAAALESLVARAGAELPACGKQESSNEA